MTDLKTTISRITRIGDEAERLLCKAFPGDRVYTDAIEAVHGDNGVEVQLLHDDLNSHVMARLSHVPVNPSNKEIRNFITSSYVYPESVEKQRGETPNRSAESVGEFVDYMISRSKIELNGYLASISSGGGSAKQLPNLNQPIVVTGARGVGKSFFFSHAISLHNDKLDEEKVVWIRINLVNDYGYDSNLIGWIHAQAMKILLRYYGINSKYRTKEDVYCTDFSKHLFGWIDQQEHLPDATRTTMQEKLANLLGIFCDPAYDRDINPVICPDLLCAEVFRFAREDLGLSFVVVLDGFDKLDSDSFHKSRFDALEEQVARFVGSRTPQGLQLIVASRNTTFETLVGHHPYRSVFTKRYFIESPSFASIFDRRIETIIGWLDQGNIAGFDEAEVFEALGIAKRFRESMTEERIHSELHAYISSLTHNNRAKCQVMQLLFQDFCQENNLGGYKIIEHMVKANFTYPPIAYHHTNDDGTIQPVPTGDYIYDSRFLPIITRPPISFIRQDELLENRHLLAPEYICLEIRIIQLISLWSKRYHSGGLKEALTKAEILEVLCGPFGYDANVVRAAIHDLESFEVLIIDRRGAFKTESDDDRVYEAGKADFIIRRYLHDIAYLNFCGMRTLVSQDFLQEFNFLQPASLSQQHNVGRSRKEIFRHWTSVKITNSLAMAFIVNGVNERQRNQFREWSNELSPRLAEALSYGNINSMFTDLDMLLANVAREIFSATSSPNSDYNFDDLSKALSDFESVMIDA